MDVRADSSSQAFVKSAFEKPRSKKTPIIIGAIALALIVGGLIFSFARPKPPASGPAAGPGAEHSAERSAQLVTIVRAEPRDFSRTALVSGQVRPVDDVRVFAQSTGVRIAEVLADVGDEVSEGQPLARLDEGVADAQILAAEAQFQEARIEAARTAQEYESVKPIEVSGAYSKQEIDTRRAAAEAATARVAAQRAALAQVKARLQGGYVRAPAAGLVIERDARVGEIADQRSLFRIVGGNKLEVAASVSESDVLMLKVGQEAKFVTGDGETVTAVLRRPAVAINPSTGVGEALFDLPADTTVRSGMYLRGEVVIDSQSHIAAPQTAISYANDRPNVFIIEDGKAVLRPVTLGAAMGDYVAILSGVKAGEKIAASGGAFLMDGDPVRVADADAKQAVSAAANK